MRKVLSVLMACGLVLSLGTTASPAAAVDQKTVTVTRPYTQNWVFRSTRIKACVFIEISGSLVAKRRYAYRYSGTMEWDPRTYYWYGAKLKNPTLKARAWPIRGAGCDSTRSLKLSKFTITQKWYEGGCDLSAQFSASYPWGIGVTPTYSCGNHRVAQRSTTYGAATRVAQYNTGYPAYFKGALLAPRGMAWPVRGNITGVFQRKIGTSRVSDAFTTKRAVAFMK
jgi:hypothetical protein